jgi:hypothetical protein
MNEVEMVTIAAPMLQAVADLLRRGGSRLENDLMADRLVAEANAPLERARQQAEFNAAVAAATADQAKGSALKAAIDKANAEREVRDATGDHAHIGSGSTFVEYHHAVPRAE